jgi:holo-[acyl-carrier protein] synthase
MRSPGSDVVVGVDLVYVPQVAASIARFGDRYTRRFFTDGEVEFCRWHPALADARFAARFAAKEATMKVLRPLDTDVIGWRSIEVCRTSGGWCDIVLHGEAKALAERANLSGLTVSMSHEHEYAIATVVAQRAPTSADE